MMSMEHDLFRRFWVSENDSSTGFRLGGHAPDSVRPRLVTALTRYLMTVPLSETEEVSIFIAFDHSSDDHSNPFESWLTLFDETNPLVQFVVHPFSKRSTSGDLASEIPGRALIVEPSECLEDVKKWPLGYPHHKLGGRPYFSQEDSAELLERANQVASAQGHLFQLAFPSSKRDAVLDCDWPFGECVFNVFGRGRSGFTYGWG